MRRVLVIGGGYAGFYTAWKLEKKLRRDEAEVVVVDPRPYMTYQPFLPEVVAGSVEARHAAISLRRNLHRTKLVAGMVNHIEHQARTVVIRPAQGSDFTMTYDILVVTAGAVTRTFDVPGVADRAIGLKHVEEAVAIRDRVLTAFDEAACLPPGRERSRLLTFTFVGGGFSGVEGFAELMSLAQALVKHYPELSADDLAFHLVEATGRILPEVTEKPGRWVVRMLERRGAHVHLGTTMDSAEDGHVVLSDGTTFDSELVVWTAGNAATRLLRNYTDLPHTPRGWSRSAPTCGSAPTTRSCLTRGPRVTMPRFPTWPRRCRVRSRFRTRRMLSGRASGWRRIWSGRYGAANRGTTCTAASARSRRSAWGRGSSSTAAS